MHKRTLTHLVKAAEERGEGWGHVQEQTPSRRCRRRCRRLSPQEGEAGSQEPADGGAKKLGVDGGCIKGGHGYRLCNVLLGGWQFGLETKQVNSLANADT
jgi:hypothetical protein